MNKQHREEDLEIIKSSTSKKTARRWDYHWSKLVVTETDGDLLSATVEKLGCQRPSTMSNQAS